jgi:hypothetical protein
MRVETKMRHAIRVQRRFGFACHQGCKDDAEDTHKRMIRHNAYEMSGALFAGRREKPASEFSTSGSQESEL